jgi:uracil-DNA glycosylase
VVRKVRILKNKYVDLFKSIHPSWHPVLMGDDSLLKELKDINDKLVKEINDDKADILPYPYDLTFNCFNLCEFDQLKVVILGQDPYFSNKNEAMGLSFSVPEGVSQPPTLKNIFKELASDVDSFKIPKSGDLTAWAKQGVLLLNTSLTVIHKNSASHMETWKPFTNEIVKKIAEKSQHVVFILWGKHAKSYRHLISTGQHLILESVHPSPMSASAGFFGNQHFSNTNKYLKRHGKQEINWHLVD